MEFLIETIKFPELIDDRSIAFFQAQTDLATRSIADVLLVDFSDVQFMSSTGLMALVMVFKRARESRKKLFLCSVNEQVKMLLELTGMETVFTILDPSLPDSSTLPNSLSADYRLPILS
jgi:anti-sigma B factor antagonist